METFSRPIKGKRSLQESTEKPLQLSDSCPTCHKLWVPAGSMSRMDLTNRFDPYEALDNINIEAQCASTRACAAIRADVTALRAYITGMEK